MERMVVLEGSAAGGGEPEYLVIESCHSNWYFDVRHRRFRRILRGFDGRPDPPATEWRAYFGIEEFPESDSFEVWLNPQGTRLVRAWRHRQGCPLCQQPQGG